MLKITFIKSEFEIIKEKICFTPRQLRILDYRQQELSRVKMAELENLSVNAIDYEIGKIAEKIKVAYDKGIINF